MKALLVTHDGCTRLIDLPERWPKLRMPFTTPPWRAFAPLGATPLHPADAPELPHTRTYELTDEVRAHGVETIFVYTECRG